MIAVTEPGVAGVHDLERLIQLTDFFKVKTAIILNKADLHPASAQEIKDLARAKDIPLIAEIPFLEEIPKNLSRGLGLNAIPQLSPPIEAALNRAIELL